MKRHTMRRRYPIARQRFAGRRGLQMERLEDRILLSAVTSSPRPAWGELSLSFISNSGQADPAVQFHVRGAGHDVAFASDVVVFRAQGAQAENSDVRLRFAGGNTEAEIVGLDPLPGTANFFIGSNPDDWHTGIPTYAALEYRALYPGIDLRYTGSNGHLKSEFHVAPGADSQQIQMDYAGMTGLEIRADGALLWPAP